MSAQPELWRVSTIEGIFETDLETLKQWIVEGCVLPTDKVSKGNLSWIEAGRVPKLKPAFNPDARPQPVTTSFEAFVESNPAYGSTPAIETVTVADTRRADLCAHVCQNHPELDPEYVCRMCSGKFCRACTRFVRDKVPVCPLCGDLCHEYRAIAEQTARREFQSEGFGLVDFFRAVRYPLRHKTALVTGALIYAFLLMAGFRGAVVAWMVMFGCISHVISQVAWGRLNRSFMPDFSAFSLWDDLVVPIFLGIGIMIVTWGPVIALTFVLIYNALSGGVGPSPLHTAPPPSGPDLSVLTDPNADPAKLEAENQKLQGLRPGTQMAREADASKDEANDPAGAARYLFPYLSASVSIALLFLLLIGWALFYYPMALTVAGYTQSFGSVLNPLVGLDTIRRMGVTYFKGFGMVVGVQIVAFVVSVIVGVITSPLTLPFMGNLLGNFISASFSFYFNLVIACILGLSLFKCSDRLGISVD